MAIHVQFDDEMLNQVGVSSSLPEILENTALEVLKWVPTKQDYSLTLVITGDQQVRELNRQYSGIDESTDVLSFPAGEFDPDENDLYLGDVVISYPTASKQAAVAVHSLESELQLLVVHGVLHLLGYDHQEFQQKSIMWSIQDDILTSLGCPARPA